MIINKQILSIPPFISTSWKDVELLLSDGHSTLNIYLKNGTLVKISNLLKEDLDLIFKVHQDILLTKAQPHIPSLIDPTFLSFSGSLLEHDPDLKDASPLPDEVKAKLKGLLEEMPKLDKIKFPEVHDDCNCPFCQIMTLLQEDESDEEELVSDEDLHFSTWKQDTLTDHLIKLIHPFNEEENYIVSLDHPITCSCGQTGCEHIEHVLRN
jgi:hypothetical protein